MRYYTEERREHGVEDQVEGEHEEDEEVEEDEP